MLVFQTIKYIRSSSDIRRKTFKEELLWKNEAAPSTTKMNQYIIFAFVIAVVCGSPMVKRQAPANYELPSGAELIVSAPISHSFDCSGRIYGYYADTLNNCQIFHVCVPDVLPDGQLNTRIYSFVCGNQTIFDQSQLTCNHPQDAGVPCDQSELFYSKNEDFGKTDRPQGRN